MLFRTNICPILSANDLDTPAEHMPRIPWFFSCTYRGSINGDTHSSTDTFSETFVITAVSVMLIRMPLPLKAAKYNLYKHTVHFFCVLVAAYRCEL